MDISAALASLSQTLGLIKTLREIKHDYDIATLKSQMAEIYMALSDVRMALTDAREVVHQRDKRIKELQDQIVALTSGEACPLCNKGRLKVTAVKPHPTFEFAGVQEKFFKCSECAHTEKRLHDPSGITKSKR